MKMIFYPNKFMKDRFLKVLNPSNGIHKKAIWIRIPGGILDFLAIVMYNTQIYSKRANLKILHSQIKKEFFTIMIFA